MNKRQAKMRAEAIATIARNYPGVDAEKLQDALYRLALKCERNALELCNTQDHVDQRDQLRKSFDRICKKYGVELRAEIGGDPRGYCLKLHLPDGAYNTWGGRESGYGIGSN